MKVKVRQGKYILAVSGGVDSMVLLDFLRKQPDLDLVVAHFNHGIRPDAKKDEELVGKTAKKNHLPFEVGYGKLGPNASEDQAREARYRFLRALKKEHGADAIITAHHQDDMIETAILNILRGTGRRGLTAISGNPDILRPMLHTSKADILAYAEEHHLDWREDPTNRDERYLRNYIRRKIVPHLTQEQRNQLTAGLSKLTNINRVINQEIANLSHSLIRDNKINRARFVELPTEVANEVLMHFLRLHGARDFDKKTIDRLSAAIKTAKAGTEHDVIKSTTLELTASEALLRTRVNS